MDSHDCREHLVYHEHEWVETHGLDCGPFERCYQRWWVCGICQQEFTEAELDTLSEMGEL
jgi:uncharacterized CHY-type Zn-finger protein